MIPRDQASRFWRRVGAVLTVWFAATVVVLVVAAETKVGPVLLTLSRRHGVHAGDVVAAVATYTAAAAFTWRLLLRWRAV